MNALAGFVQGYQASDALTQTRNRNALSKAVQDYGPRSSQAMNALAAFDPMAAIQVSQPDPRAMQAQREAARGLAQGVLAAPADMRPQVYAQALQQAQGMGIDIAGMPTQYPGDQQMQAIGALLGMDDGQRSEFERLLRTIPEDQRGQAIMTRLGLAPSADTLARVSAGRTPSAGQQQFEMLVRSGVDRETAAGIVGGRFKIGEDEYGRSRRVDLASQQEPPPVRAAAPIEAPPVDFNPGAAFGAASQAGRGLNVVTDFFGLGLAAPEAQQAANGIMAFNEGLKRQIVDAYNGRPSNYLLQSIEALLPDPRAILMGDAGALEKYRALDRELAAEESAAARRLHAPLQGNARVEAELQAQGLRGARARLGQVIDGFSGQSNASDGLPPGLKDRGWSDEEWNGLSEADRKRALEIIGGSGDANPNTPRPMSADGDLLDAVIWQESRGNPNAVGPMTRYGERAQGAAQIMPATARDPGFGVRPVSDPFGPQEARRFAGDYLSAMMRRYGGDRRRALAAYNWGPGNADKWDGQLESLPLETRNYILSIERRLERDA